MLKGNVAFGARLVTRHNDGEPRYRTARETMPKPRRSTPTMSRPAWPAVSETELPEVCSNCGDPLPLEGWHPLRASTDADGTFRVYAFCDADCLEEWEETGGGS